MSFFDTIDPLPEDPIFGLQMAFAKDIREKKINLGIGIYKDANGKSFVFSSVQKAEDLILKDGLNKDYLPIAGSESYILETAKLIFGDKNPKIHEGSIFGVQTVGGTAALRIGGEFLAQNRSKTIYIPNMTWANHQLVFQRAGLKVKTYPYYNHLNNALDFSEMCHKFNQLSEGDVVVLHGTSHNPTGINLKKEEWKALGSLIKAKKLLPFIDIAYQGFGKGLIEDAEPVRHFLSEDIQFFVAYTYAKNMGIYGERAGALFVVTDKKQTAQKIATHIKQMIRSIYSNPPLHGARVVEKVLTNPDLKTEWIDELNTIRERIDEMRTALVTGLLSKESNRHYQFLNQDISGLFIYTGLNQFQTDRLQHEFGIYIPDGRINVAGLNPMNMDYVIDSILSV